MIALRYQDYSPRERLSMLADFLEEVRPVVCMEEWYTFHSEEQDEEPMLPHEVTGQKDIDICGTAACGAGWSGVLFDITGEIQFNWAEVVYLLYGFSYGSEAGMFLFSSFWSNPDNEGRELGCEREELVARIRLYLESGVPEEWGFQDLYHCNTGE